MVTVAAECYLRRCLRLQRNLGSDSSSLRSRQQPDNSPIRRVRRRCNPAATSLFSPSPADQGAKALPRDAPRVGYTAELPFTFKDLLHFLAIAAGDSFEQDEDSPASSRNQQLQSLNKLEKQFGVELVQRRWGSSPVPTGAGRLLLKYR